MTRVLEIVVMLIMAALTLDVLWGVVTRLVMQSPSRWTEEVATFLLVWVSMLGSAVAFAHHEHLGLDYFVLKLHPSARRVAAISSHLVIIAFAASAFVYGGWGLVRETLAAGQVTPALGILKGYMYLCVPLTGVMFIVIAVNQIVRLWQDRGLPESLVEEVN
jgi:TRAP-type C4-dicarboxylate transport system permease small subunit